MLFQNFRQNLHTQTDRAGVHHVLDHGLVPRCVEEPGHELDQLVLGRMVESQVQSLAQSRKQLVGDARHPSRLARSMLPDCHESIFLHPEVPFAVQVVQELELVGVPLGLLLVGLLAHLNQVLELDVDGVRGLNL